MIEARNRPPGGLLRRLRKDTTGNTLFLVAAAILPLTAMIGAGVDISRSYLVKSRLQQACDAGALAARKFMTGGTLDSATSAKAQAFFKSNFPPSSYGSTNITFTPIIGESNEVRATASARLPMTVMTIFGNTSTDISVRCDARLDIGNTDVALVLDVTGSMGTALGSGTRISALRESVINFYETLGPGNDGRGRIRYAIVPYSTNVNVGYSLPKEYLVGGTGSGDTNWIYQTRVANMTKPKYNGTPGPTETLTPEVYSGGASISSSDCAKFGRNQSFSGFTGGSNPVTTGGPAPAATTAISYSNNATGGADWGYSGAPDTSGSTRSCRRQRNSTTTTYVLVGYTQMDSTTADRWTYRQASIDVTGYADGNPVTIYTNNTVPDSEYVPEAGQYDLRSLITTPGSTVTGGTSVTWSGCIEERDTVDTITSSTPVGTLPTGAYDLDIDLIPYDDNTRWRPIWTEMLYSRSTLTDATTGSKKSAYGCPVDRARRLMSYASVDSAPTGYSSLSSFRNFINNLTIGSGTMHDIGFVWGARFISGDGIFAADNPDTWAGQPVSRHVIFMTDGIMNAHEDEFVFHGMNELDQRVAPRGTTKTQIDAIHTRRLRIACEQAKQRNITVWIIAFAEGVASDYPDLQACASTPDHFKFAADAAALNNEFQNIASDIAQLRLTH